MTQVGTLPTINKSVTDPLDVVLVEVVGAGLVASLGWAEKQGSHEHQAQNQRGSLAFLKRKKHVNCLKYTHNYVIYIHDEYHTLPPRP